MEIDHENFCNTDHRVRDLTHLLIIFLANRLQARTLLSLSSPHMLTGPWTLTVQLSVTFIPSLPTRGSTVAMFAVETGNDNNWFSVILSAVMDDNFAPASAVDLVAMRRGAMS